jgi:hypothetical protein
MALTMTLGVATVSTSAKLTYADSKDITQKEAVDVMSTIGVLGGDEAGFRPKDELKRSEGAKIIAYLMLGPNAAEQIKGGTKYTDVPASHWAAGYIEYLTVCGVVGGIGDNKFDPDSPLTVAAFTKMLIGALGYDATIEVLGGPDWMLNVQRLAKQIGLFDGDDSVVASENVNREDAALYAFNMIKSPLVEYDNKGSTMNVNGATISFGSSKASYRVNTGKNIERYDQIDTKTTNNGLLSSSQIIEFAEEYFTKLKQIKDETDSFGRPRTRWTYDGKEIGTYTASQALLYTDTVTLGTIYKDLGLTSSVYVTTDKKSHAVTDGKDSSGNGPDSYNSYFVDGQKQWTKEGKSLQITKESNVKVGGKGVETYVYYDEGVVRICELSWYVGDVVSVYAATATKDAYITIAGRGMDSDLNGRGAKFTVSATPLKMEYQAKNTSGDAGTTGFALDDVVLYHASWQGRNFNSEPKISSVTKAEVIEGEMESFTGLGVEGLLEDDGVGTVSIGGKKYTYSSKIANVPDGTVLSKGIKLQAVLDKYGNVIDIGDYGVQNYAVVVKTGVAGSYGNDSMANLLLTDGRTTGAVKLSNKNDGSTIYSKDSETKNIKTIEVGDIVKYKIVSNGDYELTECANVGVHWNNAKDTVVSNGNATLSSMFGSGSARKANGKTVFLIKDSSGNYKAYTGIKNVPTIESDGCGTSFIITSFADTKDAAARVVYVDLTDSHAIMKSSDTIFIHVASNVGQSVNSSGDSYFEFEAYVNGEKTTLKVDSGDGLDLKDKIKASGETDGYAMFTSMTTNSRGIASLGGEVQPVYGSQQEKNNVVGLGNTWYSYSKQVKVFYINDNNEITTSSIKAIPTYDVLANKTTEIWFNTDNSDDVIYAFWRINSSAKKSSKTITISEADLTSNSTVGTASELTGVSYINHLLQNSAKVIINSDNAILDLGSSPSNEYNKNGDVLLVPANKTLEINVPLYIDNATILGTLTADSIVATGSTSKSYASIEGKILVQNGATLNVTNNIVETLDGNIDIYGTCHVMQKNGHPSVFAGSTVTVMGANAELIIDGAVAIPGHLTLKGGNTEMGVVTRKYSDLVTMGIVGANDDVIGQVASDNAEAELKSKIEVLGGLFHTTEMYISKDVTDSFDAASAFDTDVTTIVDDATWTLDGSVDKNDVAINLGYVASAYWGHGTLIPKVPVYLNNIPTDITIPDAYQENIALNPVAGSDIYVRIKNESQLPGGVVTNQWINNVRDRKTDDVLSELTLDWVASDYAGKVTLDVPDVDAKKVKVTRNGETKTLGDIAVQAYNDYLCADDTVEVTLIIESGFESVLTDDVFHYSSVDNFWTIEKVDVSQDKTKAQITVSHTITEDEFKNGKK